VTPGSSLDVAIELIVPDNTAHTVLVALRRLGYERLKQVQRADHLRLSLRGDAPDPESVMQRLAHAEVLFNPNKHRLLYAPADAAAHEEREFEAIVRDKDDTADRLLRVLGTTFAMPYIAGISRGVLWRLYDDEGPAPASRLEWTCSVLLSNAVSQTYQVQPRPKRALFGGPLRPAANMR